MPAWRLSGQLTGKPLRLEPVCRIDVRRGIWDDAGSWRCRGPDCHEHSDWKFFPAPFEMDTAAHADSTLSRSGMVLDANATRADAALLCPFGYRRAPEW